jgi:2-dehydro-3-deoxyphosphogluconate aldolase/(4S)-4-hydroxy-2-oxoglutarate aldolase
MDVVAVMELIHSERVIGIVRATSAAAARVEAAAMRAAGIAVVEVSLTTPGALEVVAELAAECREDQLIGAGTVLDAASARMAVAAGARVLISPILSLGVVRTALESGVAVIPGCSTPTEMLMALRHGAHAVKLFPANSWTPAALKTMLHALPQLPVVPTGGVTLQDASRWLDAGAVAVGIGAALAEADSDETRRVVASLRR